MSYLVSYYFSSNFKQQVKKKMGATGSKPENKIVVDDEEINEEEVMNPLRKELEELKEEVQELRKEVEEVNAERVHLMREINERDNKYYKLKRKMRQQDRLDALQEEVLYKRYESMNYYLLYKQTFIIVHESIISPELLKLMSSSSLLMNYIYF